MTTNVQLFVKKRLIPCALALALLGACDKGVQVPYVIGLTLSDAIATVTNEGLHPEVQACGKDMRGEGQSLDSSSRRVVKQVPDPGAQISPGARVSIWQEC